MKFICDFKFKKEALEKAIQVANNKKLMQNSLLKSIKNLNDLQNFDKQLRGAILLTSVASGLLRVGLDEEKALTALENIFIVEITEGELSPGNDLIH